jgi:hypothetical protein
MNPTYYLHQILKEMVCQRTLFVMGATGYSKLNESMQSGVAPAALLLSVRKVVNLKGVIRRSVQIVGVL